MQKCSFLVACSRSSFGRLKLGQKTLCFGLPKLANNQFSTMSSDNAARLDIETINPLVKKVEYAVRGPIVLKASELEKELAQVGLNLIWF